MNVNLIKYTSEPDKVCAAAALSCHSSKSSNELFKDLTNAKIEKILDMTMKKGHHSVIEHASFTFSVEGVSRSLTHQLVRHRLASYSQQSQRYVELVNEKYITPTTVKEKSELLERYNDFMDTAWKLYKFFIDQGIPKEDARFILPNATTTNITITMNARELIHFFKLRISKEAQWEIRKMANMMLKEVKKVSPVIFKNI